MADEANGRQVGTQVADELVGAALGNCVIESLLGVGGMARVYRARQEHLERTVALKVLPPYYAADPNFVVRFQKEARAMGQLSHPNIITVHDAGEDRHRLFIIMEYLAGGNLRQWMNRGLSLPEVAGVVRQVASALSYAHAKEIIHRDVKPMNVLLDGHGRAVLGDFGIAKLLADSSALTRAGAGVGTPEYMSPEQCRGAPVDARSDIYALGCMLYELLTGRTPFVADNYTALAHSHIYEQPIPPSRLNPRVSPAVQAVVLMALEKDPANRFQQATDMALALEQAVEAQAPLGRQTARIPTPGMYASVECPRCHAQNAQQQRFCSNCGLPLGPQRMGQAAAPPAAPNQAPAWVICPQCQAPNPPTNRFCTRCRANLVAVAWGACRVCGAPNPPGVRFCTTCGRPMA